MRSRTAILLASAAAIVLACAGAAILAGGCPPASIAAGGDLSDELSRLAALPAGEPFELRATSGDLTALAAGFVADPARAAITPIEIAVDGSRLRLVACVRGLWLRPVAVRARLAVRPLPDGYLGFTVEDLRVGRLSLPAAVRRPVAARIEAGWRAFGRPWQIDEISFSENLILVRGRRR